ncbi:MAG: iron chelate uptake ABC transporter family permease subunit [Clostridia bacterium]|nr:iron chelate uptake ABC transporter family permease subunit [Clostridia bacterium]
MPTSRIRRARIAGLAAVVILVVCCAASAGTSGVPVELALRILGSRVPLVGPLFRPGPALAARYDLESAEIIVLEVRLPRIVLGLLVGAGLSVTGACFQGLFRNPLADPYIIGASSGSALGASIGILLSASSGISFLAGPSSSVPLFAFVGAVVTVTFVYALAAADGRVSTDTFLLAGVVVGSFVWAVVSFLMVIAGEDLPKVVMWLMGSLSAKSWTHVAMAAPYVLAGIAALTAMGRGLNLIAMGEEPARYMGLDVERFKKAAIVIGSLITAAAVSASGLIGFIGLVVPHVARMLIGPDHRSLIPVSALGGAAFMVAADTIARVAIPPREIPVGIITAIAGAPFFFYLLRRRKRDGVF